VDLLLAELTAGFPAAADVARIAIRLVAAMALGAVLGLQRESVGAAAGLRTHMLVSVGAAMFVLAPLGAGMAVADLSRVIQGVATGIGFIGGGAVLKLTATREIQGLTTAASIWLATAVGVAVGLGHLGLAAIGVTLSWIILAIIGRLTQKTEPLVDAGREAAGDQGVPAAWRSRRRSRNATTRGSGGTSTSAK
jgi:putative Mg2+ transporter-C (MgtC) family protein